MFTHIFIAAIVTKVVITINCVILNIFKLMPLANIHFFQLNLKRSNPCNKKQINERLYYVVNVLEDNCHGSP